MARGLGLAPLSAFGWNDDLEREPLAWHEAAVGLKTVDALLVHLQGEELAWDDHAGIVADLKRIAHALSRADAQGIPFCLLLSRDLKRNKAKMIWLCCFMIFARCVDMFWLIEPNFRNAAGNLHLAGNGSILAYLTVPPAVLCLWGWYFLGELAKRPLVNTNDPHLEEMLEPEHAH